jgi:hypothetical protein
MATSIGLPSVPGTHAREPLSSIEPYRCHADHTVVGSGGFLIMRWITFAFAIVALSIFASTTMLWSRPHTIASATAAMPSLAELHATTSVSRLPVQEINDLSVIFPQEASQ